LLSIGIKRIVKMLDKSLCHFFRTHGLVYLVLLEMDLVVTQKGGKWGTQLPFPLYAVWCWIKVSTSCSAMLIYSWIFLGNQIMRKTYDVAKRIKTTTGQRSDTVDSTGRKNFRFNVFPLFNIFPVTFLLNFFLSTYFQSTFLLNISSQECNFSNILFESTEVVNLASNRFFFFTCRNFLIQFDWLIPKRVTWSE